MSFFYVSAVKQTQIITVPLPCFRAGMVCFFGDMLCLVLAKHFIVSDQNLNLSVTGTSKHSFTTGTVPNDGFRKQNYLMGSRFFNLLWFCFFTARHQNQYKDFLKNVHVIFLGLVLFANSVYRPKKLTVIVLAESRI